MKRVLIFIIAGILLCSCNNHSGGSAMKIAEFPFVQMQNESLFCENSNDMNIAEIPFVQIKNESLLREIRLYRENVNVPDAENKIVHVIVGQFQDTTVYLLNYATSASNVGEIPSTFYVKDDEDVIALTYSGVKEIGTSESIAWEYLKEVFPEEYEYYQKYHYFPLPGILYEEDVWWILTFKDGELIDKQEKKNYLPPPFIYIFANMF